MRIATLVASAIVLAVNVGSASATDQSTPLNGAKKFATLNGVKAVPLSASELSTIKGMDHHFFVNGVRHDTDQHQDALSCTATTCDPIVEANFVEILRADGTIRLAAPGYRGLILHACGNGVITGPSSAWC
jgi:hypothetical protein